MKRSLKALGVAAVAVVALSAIVPAAAMAESVEHEFHSETEPTVVNATGGTQTLQLSGGKLILTCKEVHLEGTMSTQTTDDLTLGIKYTGGANGKCDSSGGTENTAWDDAGCHKLLDSDTTTGNPTEGPHANVTLTCPEGSLKITGTLKITIPDQVIEHAVHYDNEGSGSSRDIKVTTTAHGIEWTCSSSAFACTLGLGGTSGSDGAYTGEATARGFEHQGGSTESVPGSYETGEQVGIWVE